MTSVAFFGLGTMGGGMAARLVAAGFGVTAWNRTAGRADRLRDAGAAVAGSPRDAASAAEVAISMVADDAAARAVWLGESGALAAMRPGSVLIECSTISPGWVDELHDAATARGCSLLDAPVTGSRTQAATGELRFLVGGSTETLDRVRPVFDAMGRDVFHLGPPGSGARMKLINNFLCGVQAASLAEATALIERSGLNRDLALTILKNGAPGSPLVGAASTRMSAEDYTVHFKLALMRKDLAYAIAEARRFDLTLATAATAQGLFERAESRWGELDFSAVVEPLRARN